MARSDVPHLAIEFGDTSVLFAWQENRPYPCFQCVLEPLTFCQGTSNGYVVTDHLTRRVATYARVTDASATGRRVGLLPVHARVTAVVLASQ